MATHVRTCPLCEATCGILVETEGTEIRGVRGDPDDPFSRGYICPKAYGVKALHDDPDRLRAPLVRVGGELREASWDQAFAAAIEKLTAVRAKHGPDAIAIYLGNPTVHSLDLIVYGQVLIRALATKQRYSASSADQLPKMVTSALLFGGGLSIPIPDIDRTDRMMILGGNPRASNGSLMTAPDLPGRLDALVKRGGKVVVIDPRRGETAAEASEHHFIRPGTDALLLLAIVHVLFADRVVKLGAAADYVDHLDRVEALASRFAPERVAARIGIDGRTIRRIAHEHAGAASAICYGRIGTTCQEFGTLASWAVDLVNILTGNLDRTGGVMFTTPAVQPGRFRKKSEARFGRFTSRVHHWPEMFGELPIATLADEIMTAGDGVRALVTVAGNPLSSAPNVRRLTEAVESLDVRIAVDPYLNETTRLADVVLPPPGFLECASYDIAFYQLSIRNIAKFAIAQPATGRPAEWEIMLTLAKGMWPAPANMINMAAAPLAMADDLVAREVIKRELEEAEIEMTPEAALAALGDRRGPARLIDLYLRIGPYGDRFGAKPGGLTLDALIAKPHGIDLGPLVPRLPEVLRTQDRRIDLAPALVVGDLARLEASLVAAIPELVLIGRRHLRSNNSWMHNLPSLVKGPARCTLLVHPTDASRLGLSAGRSARITSRVGEVVAPIEITDTIMPGVVSLPHGFGHDLPGMRMEIARAHAGVNINVLSDDTRLDMISGNVAFNGVVVSIIPA